MFSYFMRAVPVWRLFWIYIVIVAIILGFSAGYLLNIADTTEVEKTRTYAQTARVVIAGLATVYFFNAFEGLCKAAYRDRFPGVWGYCAIGITGLLVPISAHFAYDPWHYKYMVLDGLSRVPPSDELLAEVDGVQSNLPRSLTKSMKVENAVLEKRELIFEVNAVGRLGDSGAAAAESKMWTMLTKQGPHCEELQTAFEEGLWTAVFEVRYDDSTFFARLTPKQCAEGYEHQDLTVKKRF